MHEQALVRRLREAVEAISAAHGGLPIVRARVALGAMSHLDEARLRALWPEAMAGTSAEGSRVEVESLSELDDPRGSALVLRSVTFEDGATPPIAGPGGSPAPRSSLGGD